MAATRNAPLLFDSQYDCWYIRSLLLVLVAAADGAGAGDDVCVCALLHIQIVPKQRVAAGRLVMK
jgi:hypothetical protein